MIERACLPEPPCDCLTVTSCPVFAFHAFAKAWLNSTYSSRVGSYDTLSSVTGFCCATARDSVPARARARGILIKSRRRLMEGPPVVNGRILQGDRANGNDQVLTCLSA